MRKKDDIRQPVIGNAASAAVSLASHEASHIEISRGFIVVVVAIDKV